ncbi:hypothetical protein U8335_04305 [Roseiconus lacunae]|uniref:hypothetical protein n=1 Tax=Roseiconus lacunae TaxID=2605694 RepID=UPI00308E3DCD|nr:hypothetical protein U8335_04305 [Stieleria sp. HD01]
MSGSSQFQDELATDSLLPDGMPHRDRVNLEFSRGFYEVASMDCEQIDAAQLGAERRRCRVFGDDLAKLPAPEAVTAICRQAYHRGRRHAAAYRQLAESHGWGSERIRDWVMRIKAWANDPTDPPPIPL